MPPHGFALPSSNNGTSRAGRSASLPQEKGPQLKTCRVMINHGPRTGKETLGVFIPGKESKYGLPFTPQPKGLIV